MSAVPVITSAAPAVTAQDLELEHAEPLPARETLWITRLCSRYFPQGPAYPGGPVHFHPDPPVRAAQYA